MAVPIVLYATETCPYCHMAREYLEGLPVDFEVRDVGKDEAAAREMVEKSGQMGVPVIEVGDLVIVGFDRGTLEKALKDAGLVA